MFRLYLFAEVTTWPRMDNDPPGSWNGVVQTPLRKLWVQCQRVATSMSKVQDLLVGYPRAPFASVVTVCPRDPPSSSHSYETQCRLLTASRCSGVRAYAGTEGRSGALPGGVLEDPSGTPQKGGSGTPQKGGCRDTKQCKFWRVSSVLIQGMFCFWGVRGGFGGSRRGSFLGSFLGSQRPGKWTHKPPHPGPAPAPIRPEQKSGRRWMCPRYLRCRGDATGCWRAVGGGSA